MAEPNRRDEDVAGDLLRLLRHQQPEPSPDLPEKTIRRVRASITGRDLIDLTTVVFLLRFCAPVLDLLAAFFGNNPTSEDRSTNDE